MRIIPTQISVGGKDRKAKNNVFCKLNKVLDREVIGVGCAAHIVHNAIQRASDYLPVDVETIMMKIYLYFYIYTVRVETLKEFCNFVNFEYPIMLDYSKTRRLALMPVVERKLKNVSCTPTIHSLKRKMSAATEKLL